jgi:hypothetical protein
MAFWIKKTTDRSESPRIDERSVLSDNKKGKKDDAKPQVKRIDNLRIPERLRVHLKSLGSQNVYTFWTKDLSSTGAFVLCQDFHSYPFQSASTILEAVVELKDPVTNEVTDLALLAKIARVVEAHGAGASNISGFGIRIVQMEFRERQVLENFIESHGMPNSNPAKVEKKDTSNSHALQFEGGIGSQPTDSEETSENGNLLDTAG